jgi:hypothetical protein
LPRFDVSLIDAILALVACEAMALTWLRRRRARGPTVTQTLTFLGSGAALLLALRAVLAGWPTWAPLLALAVAGLAHVAHLTADVRRRGGSGE